jgi:hypothetical protein
MGERLPNQESNFNRALSSLQRRDLVFRWKSDGCHPFWILTEKGMEEAVRFTEDGGIVPPKSEE